MRIHRLGQGLLAAAVIAPLAMAQAQQPTIEELLQRLEQQEQAIKVLERRLEIKEETDATAAKSAGQVKASERGFSLQSADGKNQVKLRGVLQTDGRHMVSDEADLPDTFQITRARPIIEGTVGGIYDFRFTPDFGQGRTVIQDASVTGRFAPSFQVTAGKFKSPVGLERLQSATDIRFVARAFPTSLVPNRDIGFKVEGNLIDERLNYAVAFVNGSNDGGSSETFADVDVTSDKEYAARLFAQPFANSDSFALRGLGLGIAGTYTDHTGNATQPFLPSFRTPAQATVFRYRADTTPTIADGERTRLAPQLYYYAGRFGLLGEYTEVSQDVSRALDSGIVRSDTIDTTAWQLAASFFLTGEEATYRGYKPNSSFSIEDGTWGAFELTARYHELDIDDAAFAGGGDSFADPSASVRKASGYTLGLNWYLNQNLKWVINYERTSFDGGAPDGGDRDDEEAVLTRVAVGF
jgi:phosphate-selective porin OprO and OprP